MMDIKFLKAYLETFDQDPELFQEYIKGLEDKMGIPGEFIGASWDNFDLGFNPENKEEYDSIKAFGEVFDIEGKLDLFLMGNVGTGKTRLVIMAGKDLIKQGLPVYFVNQAFLNRRIRDLRKAEGWDNSEQAYRNFNVLKKIHVLIIDDLGKGNITPEIVEYTSDLIEERIHEGYVTFITTNFQLEELEAIFLPSTIDRIKGSSLNIVLTGESYRTKGD